MSKGVFVRFDADRFDWLLKQAEGCGASASLLIATIIEEWVAQSETTDGDAAKAVRDLVDRRGIPKTRKTRPRKY